MRKSSSQRSPKQLDKVLREWQAEGRKLGLIKSDSLQDYCPNADVGGCTREQSNPCPFCTRFFATLEREELAGEEHMARMDDERYRI